MAGGLRDDSGDDAELSEINITPFIDVMLVLLIIFMVASPLSTVDVAVDLPTSNARAEKRPDKPIFVTLKADRTLALGETPVRRDMLAAALDSATETRRDTRIFLRADKTVPYGELMSALNLMRAAGYLKVALVGLEAGSTEPTGPAAPSPSETPQ